MVALWSARPSTVDLMRKDVDIAETEFLIIDPYWSREPLVRTLFLTLTPRMPAQVVCPNGPVKGQESNNKMWWAETLQRVVNLGQSSVRLVVQDVAFELDLDKLVWADVVSTVERVLWEENDGSQTTRDEQSELTPRLAFKCNWETDAFIAQLFSKLFLRGFLADHLLEGWTIVVNAIQPSSAELPDPKRTIVLRMEPDCDDYLQTRWDEWLTRYPTLTTKADFAYWGEHKFHLNPIEWHLPLTCEQAMEGVWDKGHVSGALHPVSAVCSAQGFMLGHQWRLQFLRLWYGRLQTTGVPPLVLWGKDGDLGMPSVYKGSLPAYDKSQALDTFRYTFAGENCQKNNYVTEKLWDAVLTETVCFYHGPPVHEWLEPDSYVSLSDNLETAFSQMCSTVQADRYVDVHLPALRRTKTDLMCRWSLQARVRDVVHWHTVGCSIKIINLLSRPDRWARFQQNARQVNLLPHQYERFDAIDGSKLDYTLETSVSHIDMENILRPLRTGEIGVINSHVQLWKDVVKSGRPCLVMEDDVVFGPPAGWTQQEQEHPNRNVDYATLNWWDQLRSMFSRLPDHWDYAALGWNNKPRCKTRSYETRRNKGRWLLMTELFRDSLTVGYTDLTAAEVNLDDGFGSFGGGTYAYLVSPSGAAKLLSHKCIMPVDYHIMQMVREGILVRAYAYSAPIVHGVVATLTNKNDSDIQRTSYVFLKAHADKFKGYLA